MPFSRLIFILVTVLTLAGGTIALWMTFFGTGGGASLPQIVLLSLAVATLAIGVRFLAPRERDDDDN